MSIFCSLLCFRGLFIAVFVAFFLRIIWEYDYERILQKEYQEEQRNRVSLSWFDVDIFAPPLLGDVRLERMRLNEFLSKRIANCENEVRLGDSEKETYVICGEVPNRGMAVSITGDTQATGRVESSIIADKWIVFAPEETAIIDQLKGDVEVNYLTQLQEWKNWHIWDFEQNLKNKTFDIVKLDLYTHFFNVHDQPKVIRKLIQLFDTRFLLLNIDVGSKNDRNYEEVVGAWYRLLYYLFYKKNYVLIGASTRGVCGQVFQNCHYHVSLMRVNDLSTVKKAPPFGLGSPLEEKHRLMVFLTKVPADCHLIRNSNFVPFCERTRNNVIIISDNQSLRITNSLQDVQQLNIISPYEERNTLESNEKAASSPKLRRLEDILAGFRQIDLLLVNIDGGEMDILPQLLEAVNTIRIDELVVSGRLFHEENENYRSFFWDYYRLLLAGYKQEFGRVHLPIYYTGFRKK